MPAPPEQNTERSTRAWMKRRRETSASRNRRLLEVNLCRENHGDWNSVQHRRFVSPLFDAVDRSFDKKRMARHNADLIDGSIFGERGLKHDRTADPGLPGQERVDRRHHFQ